MKRFNKILAVVLVISMLASFMSVSVFAVDLENASYRLSIRDIDGKVISSASAGDVVDLVISIKTNGYTPTFTINFCYDYTLLTQTRQSYTTTASTISATNCRELLGNFADKTEITDEDDPIWQLESEEIGNGYYLLWGAGTSTATTHKDTMYPSTWGDTEKAQYKCVNYNYTTDPGDSVLVPDTKGEYWDVVRFRFIANVDTVLDDSVIFVNPDAAKTFIAMDPDDIPLSNLQTTPVVKVSNLTIEYEAPAANLVYHVKNQVQWNDQAANSINIGVVAGFDSADIPIVFDDDNVSTNVTAVGADFAINDVAQAGKTTTRVYMVNSGEKYYFRIVLGNISTTTEDTYTVTPYVVYDGQPYYAEAVTITPDDVATLAAKLA